MSNFIKEEVIYIQNKYLRTQAIKLLKTKPAERDEQEMEDFWFVFNRLCPGYLGTDMVLRGHVESVVLWSNIRVIVKKD